jgi:hypothetical protein
MGMGCANGHLEHADLLPSHRGTLAQQGTISVVFERLGMTYDNSWSATDFKDSSGSTEAIQRYLWMSRNPALSYERSILWNGAGNKAVLFTDKSNGKYVHSIFAINNSRYVVGHHDPVFAEIVWTWTGRTSYVFVEGHLINVYTRADAPEPDEFKQFAVGGFFGSTSGGFGNFRIKRITISSHFSPPTMLPVKVGMLGDSFTIAGDEAFAPAVETVDGIDAVQEGLVLTDNNSQYNRHRGQASWIFFLQSLSWLHLGSYFSYYRAAKGGAGFEKNQIPKAYRDALINYKPDIIIAHGSTNDVKPLSPVTDLVSHTKAILDELIDGIPNLRQILFFETFSGHQCIGLTAGWLDELKRVHGLYRAGGIHGYRGKVQYIQTYDTWGGDNYDPHFSLGSNPDNQTASGPPPYGPGNDLHPSASGHAKMAEIIWPSLYNALV